MLALIVPPMTLMLQVQKMLTLGDRDEDSFVDS
jgi:hypothetical protein